jgi:endonuclease YncB( thermonuclease family)
MRRRKGIAWALILAAGLGLAAGLAWFREDPPHPGASRRLPRVVTMEEGGPPPRIAGPVRVIDGDSLEVAGRRVRLIGIDALERSQTCRDRAGATIACGRQAQAALEALLRGGTVACEVLGEDRFDRLLARCTNPQGVEVNRAMVGQGWALAYPGDDSYAAEERAARMERRGIHAWQFVPPAEWRRGQR